MPGGVPSNASLPLRGSVADGPVRINEIMAANLTGLRDEDGDVSDWIELFNVSNETVRLEGWSLTDDRGAPDKWAFPAVDIGPNQYLVVFASGKDRRPGPGGELHTNFALDAAGEFLALYPPERRRTLAPRLYSSYPPQTPDTSYGVFCPEGCEYRFFTSPTPGGPNNEASVVAGIVAPVEFSAARGFHDRPFRLRLATQTSGARIRYTQDGSPPGPSQGEEYRGPLWIRATTVVRARAFKDGWKEPPETAATFVVPDSVLGQTRPHGYPVTWGEGLPAHYDMAPDIVRHPDYADRMRGALRALPVVSIAAAPEEFFDADRGIYTNTEREGPEWERPVSMEFFTQDGRASFHVPAGIQIQGRSSRKPLTSPKHSFRIVFKRAYGAAKLRYPLFGPDGADEFDTLVLRAGNNDAWTYPLAELRARAQYARDAWAHAVARAMGRTAPRTRFVHLYLNGLYWGVYSLSERPDDAFIAAYYGGTKEDYEALKGAEFFAGDAKAWNTAFSLARSGLEDESRYDAFTRLVDIDSFIDFMLLNHYGGNENWDYGNWYAARRIDNGRFIFFCWDMENILGRVGDSRVFTRNIGRPTELFHRLRENARFRAHFEERLRRHCFGDGALTPEAAARRYREITDELERAIIAESARWGSYRRDLHPYRTAPFDLYTRDGHWQAERDRLLHDYFPKRTAVLLEQYRSAGLYSGQ